MRLTKKTAGSLVRRHGEFHALHGRRWKRLNVSGDDLGFGDCGVKRVRLMLSQHGAFPRVGVGQFHTGMLHRPASPGLCMGLFGAN